MQPSYDKLLQEVGGQDTHAGLLLHDMWPRNDDMRTCSKPLFTPRNMENDRNLCYNNFVSDSSYVSQHSLYSLQMSKHLQSLNPPRYQYSSVHQIGQAGVGGFLGSPTSATWEGMGSSLREALILGMAGQSQIAMPAC